MYKATVRDNGGTTVDRYTVEIKQCQGSEFFGMSDNCLAPNGFNQYIGDSLIMCDNDLPLAKKAWPASLRIGIARRIKQLRS